MFECVVAGLGTGQSLMLAGLFLTGTLVTFLVLWVEERATARGHNSDTLRLLRAQLAKGTISLEEYNYLKKIL